MNTHKIIIKNLSNVITNEAQFESLESLNNWFDYHISIGTLLFEDKVIPAVLGLNDEVMQESYVIPLTHTFEIIDITTESRLEAQKVSRIEAGKAAREKCQNVLDLIAGYNLERSLTIEQITSLQQTFSNAENALRASRPDFAKSFIEAIIPDGVLVTQEMKEDALLILG